MEASRRRTPGEGWVTFAGTLFLLVGTFNIINGVALLVDDNYFRSDELLFGDLSTWGWLLLIGGAGQIVIGFGILADSVLAQVVGVFWAGFNAMGPSACDRGLPGVVDHHHGDRRPPDLCADHVRTSIQRGIGPV